MGLFDGKIIELGNTLAANLDTKANNASFNLEGALHSPMPPTAGESFQAKVVIQVLHIVAQTIRESVNKE